MLHFRLELAGYLKINGEPTPKRKRSNVLFWEDSTVLDIKYIEVKVYTKEPYIILGNIWEVTYSRGEKQTTSVGMGAVLDRRGAAMYSEDIEDGKRYFCNDGDMDDDFDDIIFTVKRMPLCNN